MGVELVPDTPWGSNPLIRLMCWIRSTMASCAHATDPAAVFILASGSRTIADASSRCKPAAPDQSLAVDPVGLSRHRGGRIDYIDRVLNSLPLQRAG